MDLKTIEFEILKINEEFINFLDQVTEEVDNKVEAMFRDLNLKVEEKSAFIKLLETTIIEEDEVFKSKLNEFFSKLDELMKQEKPLKYILDDAIDELKKQKNEELKPYLLQQKKTKTELTHKITAQKKELSFLLKDSNQKLIEEEKNFKNRDFELSRRMNIDLDRLNENNVKQYSDIEKSILETENRKQIKESQKKINSIRLVGVKEILNIKNKYALQNLENTLAFKKFQEKTRLDNATLTEEFKQRIKTLENEKEAIEIEEKQRITIGDFENTLKLFEFERENELDKCVDKNERIEQSHIINKNVLSLKKEKLKNLNESINRVNNEIYSFDKTQVYEFILGDNYYHSAGKKIIDNLLSSLKNYIITFNSIILISFNDYTNKRKIIIGNLLSLLSGNYIDTVYGSNTSYQDLRDSLSILLEKELKILSNNSLNFSNILKEFIKGMESHISLTVLSIKEFYKNYDTETNQFYKQINNIIEEEFKNKNLNNDKYSNEKVIIAQNKWSSDKKEYKFELNAIKEKTKKIIEDYNIKKQDVLEKIEIFKKETNLKLEKNKKDLKKYIKQSKLKINNVKKIYNANIVNHEKIEYKAYKEVINQNKLEHKNRLESL